MAKFANHWPNLVHGVVLRGPNGCGFSRLQSWGLCRPIGWGSQTQENKRRPMSAVGVAKPERVNHQCLGSKRRMPAMRPLQNWAVFAAWSHITRLGVMQHHQNAWVSIRTLWVVSREPTRAPSILRIFPIAPVREAILRQSRAVSPSLGNQQANPPPLLYLRAPATYHSGWSLHLGVHNNHRSSWQTNGPPGF